MKRIAFGLCLFVLLCAPALAGDAIQWRTGSKEADLKPLDLKDFKSDPMMQSGKIHEPPWFEPVTGMEFVFVPGGCFQMGSNFGESNEKPVHEVCVDGFWMGKYEVTQAEWQRVMGSNPSRFKGDRNPVEQVSWNDAQEFIKRLNAKGNGTFRLPTEAEWEYAARSGGKDEKYAGGNDVDRVAWNISNSGGRTHPVGTKAPNGLDLYDMSGNVWEWCQDWYNKNAYSQHFRQNPIYSGGGADRVGRGGSWLNGAGFVRAASRFGDYPGVRNYSLGFRLIRDKLAFTL